jgi:inactivated superfamily I helicase
MKTVFQGDVFADYHQFYLNDANVLVVFTARNFDVPVRVELHETEPSLRLDQADHVVVADLRSTGTIVIAGCTDYWPDAARFSVPPGQLRVAIVFTGLDTISRNGLEGDDRYTLHLWPGKAAGIQVLKQAMGAASAGW